MSEKEAAERAFATFRRLAQEAQDRALAREKRDDEERDESS